MDICDVISFLLDDILVVWSKGGQTLMVEYAELIWNQVFEVSQELSWQTFADQMHSSHLTRKSWHFALDHEGKDDIATNLIALWNLYRYL